MRPRHAYEYRVGVTDHARQRIAERLEGKRATEVAREIGRRMAESGQLAVRDGLVVVPYEGRQALCEITAIGYRVVTVY